VWLAAVAGLWAWHAPALYDLALRSPWVHRAEHVVFLGTWFLFWRLALDRGSPRRLARGADVVFVVSGGLAAGALGAILALAPLPLYPAYLTTTAAWGLTPLQDQRLAGLLMWVPTGVESLAIAACLFVALLRHAERVARREDEARNRALHAQPEATGSRR
jgi:cytochrome c oxidase assembly factor CtaG